MAAAGGRGTLVVMGSGETSPTMVTLHQQLLARHGASPRALVLDSPAGFQENVAELTDKAIAYFADSVGATVAPLSFRGAHEAVDAPVEHARAMTALAAADWVFAGPGSPTYALRTWEGSAVPEALRTVLGTGGTVVMASAASLTLGAWTVPVYEIYKVGEAPQWRAGLDLVGAATGWSCAVIPHFDNNDGGGTHDTRFCYLGQRRLELLEGQLPTGAFVLGVDEHTALVLDLDQGSASVHGRGGVTLRVRGETQVLATGAQRPIDELTEWISDRLGAEGGGQAQAPVADAAVESEALAAALEDADLGTALAAVIALDREAQDASHRERVRAALARIAARTAPEVDVRAVVAPFVDALLQIRLRARADKRWADADVVRDALAAAGVEVRDTADGAEWDLT